MNIQIFLRIQHGLFLWRVLIFFGNKKLARGNRRLWYIQQYYYNEQPVTHIGKCLKNLPTDQLKQI